ncbi:MAG: RNA 2'-phosphotransferase [Bacteroidota bacterium]
MKPGIHKKISKLMSYALRHQPEALGLELDDEGWVATHQLISGLNKKIPEINLTMLEEVVRTNDKKRFAFSGDQTKIRASQGHSIAVDLHLIKKEPPQVLYHGTVSKSLDKIKKEGLHKMSRQHVHLSSNIATAKNVGGRRGQPVILMINASQMHRNGIAFYQSENGVWLTDHVPPGYLQDH